MTGREASKILLTGKDGTVSLNLFYTGKQVFGPTSLLQTTGEMHKRLRRLIVEPLSLDGLKNYFQFINMLAIQPLDQWPGRRVFVLEEASTVEFWLYSQTNIILPSLNAVSRKINKSLNIAVHSQSDWKYDNELRAHWRGAGKGPISKSFLLRLHLCHLKFLEQLFIVAFRLGIGYGGGDDENKLTDTQLKDNILTLLVAGHDTTTAALTWLMKFLGENPDVLEQLREEHRQIQANRKDGEYLTWSELNKMPFTAEVISETLRRATILPWFSRKAAQDFEIDGMTPQIG
ncbi:hypothetical protein RGQ29_010480 [Quercus rubra]|uniref:Cytochrome P450 n=1 Tax=Quercus rubra TaxID=3512 RepID=A0AAN7FUI0_QUERU|nr:hypothetical protein RGQ29_010480 [Quercus rubra]